MDKITIITPTYNRANTLQKLYDSLQNQTVKNFCWIIIDDGSTDDTEKNVRLWRETCRIKIDYRKQANGGKHRALNFGISLVETELTYIVDSDDFLPEDAVELILKYHKKYCDFDICGYSFLRCYSDGRVNTAYFPGEEIVDTYLNVRINGGIGGDKAEVYFTKILQQFPFPEFPGEKFMPEDIVWMRMSGPYKMVHINECTYFCDYLEGGLTKSGRRMKLKSPNGMCLRSAAYLNNKEVCLKVKVKMMLLYMIYGKAANKKPSELLEGLSELFCRFLYVLLFLPGKIAGWVWQKNYR